MRKDNARCDKCEIAGRGPNMLLPADRTRHPDEAARRTRRTVRVSPHLVLSMRRAWSSAFSYGVGTPEEVPRTTPWFVESGKKRYAASR